MEWLVWFVVIVAVVVTPKSRLVSSSPLQHCKGMAKQQPEAVEAPEDAGVDLLQKQTIRQTSLRAFLKGAYMEQ